MIVLLLPPNWSSDEAVIASQFRRPHFLCIIDEVTKHLFMTRHGRKSLTGQQKHSTISLTPFLPLLAFLQWVFPTVRFFDFWILHGPSGEEVDPFFCVSFCSTGTCSY